MITTFQIPPSSVFVVSGGAKGITAQCTIKLAQSQIGNFGSLSHSGIFILLGRSEINPEPDYAHDCLEDSVLKKRIMENLISQGEKPTPMMVQKIFNQINSVREIKKTLAAIEQTGAKAEYINVDVTDGKVLHDKLRDVCQKFGKITGVIHGAGNLADKLIEKKTADDFEKVYNAKVQGLQNILNCCDPQHLKHLVLFSSVSGFYGNIGQSDYAIANEILNKSAHQFKKNYPQTHVVAINWGGWDSGMVTPQLKKAFTERGIDIIPVEIGTQMLVNELHPAFENQSQVVIGSPMNLPPTPLDSELKSYRIYRRMTLEQNPFLYDHTIAGVQVLPATCAMSWMVHACEEIYPGYRYLHCREFKVLKGISFNSTLGSEYILEIQEISKVDGELIEFQTKILSKNPQGKTHFHFSAIVTVVGKIPKAPIYESLNLTEDNVITTRGKQFYQNGDSSLFHGPAFQEITRVLNVNPQKITVECCWQAISETDQGQFPVKWHNPYTTDISTQSLWIWLNHFHQQVCLPGKLTYWEQFLTIPCNSPFYVSCEVENKTDTGVTANFILHSQSGEIYSRILGAKAVIWPMKMLSKK
jgi:acyl transferase domain-containing protein